MKSQFNCLILMLLIFQSCSTMKVANPIVIDQLGTVAILQFDDKSKNVNDLNLDDYFTVQLFRSMSKLDILERKNLDKIFKEQALTITGAFQDNVRLKLYRADTLILGSTNLLKENNKGSISVTIKLVNIQTGKIMWVDRQPIKVTYKKNQMQVVDKNIQKVAKLMINRMKEFLFSKDFSSVNSMIDHVAEYYLNKNTIK